MIRELIKLLRPHQWYKNSLIFLALIFSESFTDMDNVFFTFLGFIILIMASSANYILNDLIDLKNDRMNPEKKTRPLASRAVSKPAAISIFIMLALGASTGAFFINVEFMLSVISIIVVSTLYSLYLKHIIFADLITISTNFILRAASGALIIGVPISPWLIIDVFFFAMFLAVGKRYGELNYLSENADKHRDVLHYYPKEIMMALLNVFMSILILAYALFIYFSHVVLIYTVPLFTYIILRYYYLIASNNKIIRRPETAIYDKNLVISGTAFLISTILLLLYG